MSILYTLFKPVVLFFISIFIVGHSSGLVTFFRVKANILSDDLAFDFTVGLLVLLLSSIFSIIELIIDNKISKIEMNILDENKLRGTTPLYLNSKGHYKVIFIELKIQKINKKYLDENSLILVRFPRGITVNFDDYYRYSEDEENELTIHLHRYEINDIGVHRIPINITLATAHELDGVKIKVEKDPRSIFKLIKFKYNTKEITVER